MGWFWGVNLFSLKWSLSTLVLPKKNYWDAYICYVTIWENFHAPRPPSGHFKGFRFLEITKKTAPTRIFSELYFCLINCSEHFVLTKDIPVDVYMWYGTCLNIFFTNLKKHFAKILEIKLIKRHIWDFNQYVYISKSRKNFVASVDEIDPWILVPRCIQNEKKMYLNDILEVLKRFGIYFLFLKYTWAKKKIINKNHKKTLYRGV